MDTVPSDDHDDIACNGGSASSARSGGRSGCEEGTTPIPAANGDAGQPGA